MDYRRVSARPWRVSLRGAGEATIGRGRERQLKTELAQGVMHLRVDVDDEWMSSPHAVLSCRGGTWSIADLGSRNGVFVNGVRCGSAKLQLTDGDVVEIGNTLFLFRAVTRCEDEGTGVSLGLDTMSDVAQDVHAVLARVAATELSVVLQAETGAGKEVVARALHTHSGRTGAFTAVNCGALPKELVESELFGYRKGAFSGANEDRLGLVRASDGGTLFLDEIAELTAPSQVALLRVLQESKVTPVGATEPIAVDLRVIAATHQDLEAAIAAGDFREDLFARLAGLVCELPPLRERKEDIGVLVKLFIDRYAGDRDPPLRIHRVAARALFAYDWPRNIRELEAAIRSACALAVGDQIALKDLPARVRAAVDTEAQAPMSQAEEIVAALRAERGNVSAAARAVGMSRAHFHRLMKKHTIDPDDHRE